MEEIDALRRRLDDHFPHLTKSERRIASYLLASYDQAAFLPATELASTLGVSEATVVRFARAIGYDSFADLRRCLEQLFRAKITPASRLQKKLEDLHQGQQHILAKIVDMEIEYLNEVLHSIEPSDFDHAVEILLSANQIFVFGLGPSRMLADLVQLRLRRFGIPTISLTESGRDILEKLLLLRPGDAVLATGFQRPTGELNAVLTHARATGCRLVLLTDVLGPVFKDKADVILAARRGPVSTFHSLTVPMTILNALILAVAMARSDESLATLNRLHELRLASGLDAIGQVVA